MKVDALASLAARGGGDGDVDGAVDGFEELPKHCSGGVAQNSAGTTSENRGHEASVKVWGAVSHGVNAVVNTVELSLCGPL